MTANANAGLKKNMDFEVAAKFDLVLPRDVREQYGIRLTDGANSPGDDQVGLSVRRDADGVFVVLSQLDFATSSGVVLQRIALSIPAGIDQIVLRLSHAAGSNNVVASFDLLDDGNVVSTTTFQNATGTVFQGEDFVRAQIIANGAEENISWLQTDYTSTTVDQDGNVLVRLRNGAEIVQELGRQRDTASPDHRQSRCVLHRRHRHHRDRH